MNEEKKVFLGIKKWHDAGIRGQGITVASVENGQTKHSKMVLDVLKQILPEANIITSVKYWRDDEIPDELDGYTCSLEYSSSEDIEKVNKQKDLNDRGVFMTCSVGNDGDLRFNTLAKFDEWVSVGACRLTNGNIIPAVYSSETDFIDFVELTNWDTEFGNFNGSSCSAPVLQGMAMLVQCYYKKKYGRKMSNEELYEYVKTHCRDVAEEGFDNKTGYGLFILPDLEEDNVEIQLEIGSKIAYVNDKKVELDVEPIIKDGRTLVPVRFIAESLGCDVEWDALTETVTIIK